jgi:hypothetical protein
MWSRRRWWRLGPPPRTVAPSTRRARGGGSGGSRATKSPIFIAAAVGSVSRCSVTPQRSRRPIRREPLQTPWRAHPTIPVSAPRVPATRTICSAGPPTSCPLGTTCRRRSSGSCAREMATNSSKLPRKKRCRRHGCANGCPASENTFVRAGPSKSRPSRCCSAWSSSPIGTCAAFARRPKTSASCARRRPHRQARRRRSSWRSSCARRRSRCAPRATASVASMAWTAQRSSIPRARRPRACGPRAIR